MDCTEGHAEAKTSEQIFRARMIKVSEAEDIGGRGGLWGTCPLCHSTVIYPRPTVPTVPIVAKNPRRNPERRHAWDLDIEIPSEQIAGDVTVLYRPDLQGCYRDAAVIWVSANIMRWLAALSQAESVAMTRRLESAAITRIRTL
jgi:hypothetical protein